MSCFYVLRSHSIRGDQTFQRTSYDREQCVRRRGSETMSLDEMSIYVLDDPPRPAHSSLAGVYTHWPRSDSARARSDNKEYVLIEAVHAVTVAGCKSRWRQRSCDWSRSVETKTYRRGCWQFIYLKLVRKCAPLHNWRPRQIMSSPSGSEVQFMLRQERLSRGGDFVMSRNVFTPSAGRAIMCTCLRGAVSLFTSQNTLH